jgi:hypothetical protein
MAYWMNTWTKLFLVVLLGVIFAMAVACSTSGAKPDIAKSTAANSTPVAPAAPSSATASAPAVSSSINVVVAGYINHGPLQPTVRAIKDVLAKYGDKVNVIWIDITTKEGQDYLNAHQLTAHMNVIINGTSKYQVNGKPVEFTWFEGQGWTKQDLDTVLSGLVNK